MESNVSTPQLYPIMPGDIWSNYKEYYTQQIEMATLRRDHMKLQREIAQLRLEDVETRMHLASYQSLFNEQSAVQIVESLKKEHAEFKNTPLKPDESKETPQ